MKRQINYNKQLDALFDKWETQYAPAEKEKFCRDGLLYKFDKARDINALWEESSIRVLFLLKDNPHGKQDVRNWLIDEHRGEENRLLKNDFIRNIALLFYGIIQASRENRLGYSNIVDNKMTEVIDIWNKEPFALMECKKNAGGPEVSLQEMRKAFKDFGKYINEEIDILRPNVIVCFDGEDSQYDYITTIYFEGSEYEEKKFYHPAYKAKLECCLRYYLNEKVVVIKSYHPSYRGDASRIYERVISPFGWLLQHIKESKNE